MPKMPEKAPPATGIVRPRELLTRDAALRALGVGDWGWREMLKAGLKTIKQGRQTYVFGDDILHYFARLRDEQNK